MSKDSRPEIEVDSPQAFANRELSWLAFARRVLAMAEDTNLPLLERARFAGITGMLHDEFFMKRISGLKRQIKRGTGGKSVDGLKPAEQLAACSEELRSQGKLLNSLIGDTLIPALGEQYRPVLAFDACNETDQEYLRDYFERAVQPILTPLAVDTEHPFPFISNQGLNLAILLTDKHGDERFVRIKVPRNRPRWVSLPANAGVVPLEQVIAASLKRVFPDAKKLRTFAFRVTRGAEGEPVAYDIDPDEIRLPGGIVRQVTSEMKARKFAGVVRLEVESGAPKKVVRWLTEWLGIQKEDIYPSEGFIGIRDIVDLDGRDAPQFRYPGHEAVVPPRLRNLEETAGAIFEEIARGDILLHHPYHDFDRSVVRFIEDAAVDPDVLAIKLTIYRTSEDSPIVRALAEAARRGKQVAVLVEITARFDELPNIAWGQYLEREGVHVAYGVRQLKTHVKLALVIREESGRARRYLHAGTGNYHAGTARIYEDIGVLTCDEELCDDASNLFNSLTSATPAPPYRRLIVAPETMRTRFTEMIQREAENAAGGRPSGIRAKMNQLQDPATISALYRAGKAGVPITLIVRGLCCLRPGVPGLSENIRVVSVLGRFLEHSRVYHFVNGGDDEYFIGSADWMRRNLDNRVETIIPILSAQVREEIRDILAAYEGDNCSAWDCGADGVYLQRTPAEGEAARSVQEMLIDARSKDSGASPNLRSVS